jgi:hypothetical protein
MKEYIRQYPLFSLCGLNCGLCPRFQTEGTSKCPGCGGKDFHVKHPSCAVITCSKKHDDVEFCFQCNSFPCNRFAESGKVDSFISYRNVIADLKKAKKYGIQKYQAELSRKIEILEYLICSYNDGRKKGFYCISVNLLKLSSLERIMEQIKNKIEPQNINKGDKINLIVALIESSAKKESAVLKLRK